MDSNDELKEIDIENRTCYYFNDMIKFEDFNLDNILVDEESFENILVSGISYKIGLMLNIFILDSIKQISFMKNMISFTTELDKM